MIKYKSMAYRYSFAFLLSKSITNIKLIKGTGLDGKIQSMDHAGIV